MSRPSRGPVDQPIDRLDCPDDLDDRGDGGDGGYDAVVLAGGAARRLGGRSKADLDLGAGRQLDRVLAAVPDARHRVVVGDVAVPRGVTRTGERPPRSGPAAGLVAGLAAIDDLAPWVLVLAVDLVDPAAGVAALREAVVPPSADGACLVDGAGQEQWLLARYRRASLDAAVRAFGDPAGRPVHALLGSLDLLRVRAPGRASADVDTWQDLQRWSVEATGHGTDETTPGAQR